MGSIRTDMALEAQELSGNVAGVETRNEEGDGYSVTWVKITNEAGAKNLNKARGEYITIDISSVNDIMPDDRDEIEITISQYLRELIGDDGKTVLVVGLGNKDVSPDALGPKTCDHVFVTRHIKEYLPEAIDEQAAPLCAIAPGVLGTTGLETFEVIKGIVERIKPSRVIAVDALCSRNTWRIGASIQMSDAGIEPGGGIGNKRFALNKSTLGCRVIALGVPMVAYASTVAADLVSEAIKKHALGLREEKIIEQVICEKGADLIITPKNIDELITKSSKMLANAINMAVNPTISKSYIRDMTE